MTAARYLRVAPNAAALNELARKIRLFMCIGSISVRVSRLTRFFLEELTQAPRCQNLVAVFHAASLKCSALVVLVIEDARLAAHQFAKSLATREGDNFPIPGNAHFTESGGVDPVLGLD